MSTKRAKRPRCYVVYALAPEGTPMRKANDGINALVADRKLPLVVFHDHFLDAPGGVAIFDVTDPAQIDQLERGIAEYLSGWRVEIRPFIFSYNPAALDEQIAYTLRTYRDADWSAVRLERRPGYGDPSREVQTGQEE